MVKCECGNLNSKKQYSARAGGANLDIQKIVFNGTGSILCLRELIPSCLKKKFEKLDEKYHFMSSGIRTVPLRLQRTFVSLLLSADNQMLFYHAMVIEQ